MMYDSESDTDRMSYEMFRGLQHEAITEQLDRLEIFLDEDDMETLFDADGFEGEE